MNFKEMLKNDLGEVFFNTDEFAETIQYDGVNIPALINRFRDLDLASGNTASRAEIHIKKEAVTIDYHDQVFFDEAFWSVERIDRQDERVAILSVRRKEGYVFP